MNYLPSHRLLTQSQDKNPGPLTSSSNLLSLLQRFHLYLTYGGITKLHIICSSKLLKMLLILGVFLPHHISYQ